LVEELVSDRLVGRRLAFQSSSGPSTAEEQEAFQK
jgi:hypothetical protein